VRDRRGPFSPFAAACGVANEPVPPSTGTRPPTDPNPAGDPAGTDRPRAGGRLADCGAPAAGPAEGPASRCGTTTPSPTPAGCITATGGPVTGGIQAGSSPGLGARLAAGGGANLPLGARCESARGAGSWDPWRLQVPTVLDSTHTGLGLPRRPAPRLPRSRVCESVGRLPSCPPPRRYARGLEEGPQPW